MDQLPHILSQVLVAQPYMPPPTLNDDCIYLVDLRTMKPIATYGSASATAQEVRRGGCLAKLGQGWLKGMQLRHMQETRQ